MTDQYRVAGAQMDIQLGDVDANLQKMSMWLKDAAGRGAELIVFPECALTGYCFDSFEEAWQFAQPCDGPAVEHIRYDCQRLGIAAVFGLLEQGDDGNLYNSLALVEGDGLRALYRKVHLPFLGVDRFTTPGDRFSVTTVGGDVRLGMNICYDSSFPEAARVLALEGADIVVLATNWPSTAGCTPDIVPAARAMENHVYYMAINRVGTERGFTFVGRSRICDPLGNIVAIAEGMDEQLLVADVRPAWARQKHIVRVAGKHEIDRLADRRPETYEALVRPVQKQAEV